MRDIIEPTVRGMADDGAPFTGFLYAGLMISPAGEPRVLEYNVRFGDPETQPVMMRLRSSLPALCLAAIGGRLDTVEADWDPRVALGVVMASGGYPGAYDKGAPIGGLDEAEAAGCKVFHAGTARRDGQVVTAGGRVLCVTALGDSVIDAATRAYAGVDRIRFEGAFARRDIGYRAIARERAGEAR
jgi:phosphoribosylamine--glycine ligase